MKAIFGILLAISSLCVLTAKAETTPITRKTIAYTAVCYQITTRGNGLPILFDKLQRANQDQQVQILGDYLIGLAKSKLQTEIQNMSYTMIDIAAPGFGQGLKFAWGLKNKAISLSGCRQIAHMLENAKNITPALCKATVQDIREKRYQELSAAKLVTPEARDLVMKIYDKRIVGKLQSSCENFTSVINQFGHLAHNIENYISARKGTSVVFHEDYDPRDISGE